MLFTSEVQNAIEFFFGADKITFWQYAAIASTIIIVMIFMIMLYDRDRSRREFVGAIALSFIIPLVAYGGWIVTYYYNLPLNPPLELVIP